VRKPDKMPAAAMIIFHSYGFNEKRREFIAPAIQVPARTGGFEPRNVGCRRKEMSQNEPK
jgi:hypothetical protein